MALPVPDNCSECPSDTIVPVNLMLGSEHDMVTMITVAGMPEKLRLGGVVLQPNKTVAAKNVRSEVVLFIVMLPPNSIVGTKSGG